ncbi:MAG: type III pantothenate kinase [Woeseiaceae bacterium]|nr:type III pantothenate kinase [Woeseiaceae bacterium]NIP22160.1 type III pantothenate kinase [Woeseiaceae bacterium]NIS91327.1 type III pantothenate kinase [Woeseiaceae bacterium]
MTALLMDVGNSRIKWGVLDGGAVRRTGHIAQSKIRDEGLGALTSKLPRRVDTALVSNVAGPGFATRLSGVVGMHCGVEVHFARSERQACGIVNGYRQPRRLGVDRWVAMIGAWNEIQDAVVVVDAGTALTIDAIDSTGRHCGGQIMPGVGLMAASLADETSDIPLIQKRPSSPARDMSMFGGSTTAAVAHGTLNAVAGAVERAADVLQEYGEAPAVILTGGDASRILKSLGCEAIHRPHLVLQGLARILEDHQ